MTDTVHRSVLVMREVYPVGDKTVVAFDYNDPEWENPKEVIMSQDDWEDLDAPDIITVTVEPGDKLNVDSVGS